MSNIIVFPTDPRIGIASVTMTLNRKTITLRSPYTGKRQSLATAYALWELKGKFTQNDKSAAALLRSFLAQLEGTANKFRLQIPGYSAPFSGYVGNTGLVNGANQTGKTLITDGWTNSTALFQIGDYFTVNDELKMINANVSSNGSGQATLSFDPPLHTSPADNLQLLIGNQVNLLDWSQDFTNAAWSKTNCTIGTGVTDPNAGTLANSLILTTSAAEAVQQTLTVNPANQNFCGSVWIKLGTLTGNVNLILQDGGGTVLVTTVLTPTSTWTRYNVAGTFPASALANAVLKISPVNIAGTINQTLLVFGAQLEMGVLTPSTYKLTSTGDGNPTIMLASNVDEAASWDMTPPVLYDYDFDFIEAVE